VRAACPPPEPEPYWVIEDAATLAWWVAARQPGDPNRPEWCRQQAVEGTTKSLPGGTRSLQLLSKALGVKAVLRSRKAGPLLSCNGPEAAVGRLCDMVVALQEIERTGPTGPGLPAGLFRVGRRPLKVHTFSFGIRCSMPKGTQTHPPRVPIAGFT
jgi:hypothetical protein